MFKLVRPLAACRPNVTGRHTGAVLNCCRSSTSVLPRRVGIHNTVQLPANVAGTNGQSAKPSTAGSTLWLKLLGGLVGCAAAYKLYSQELGASFFSPNTHEEEYSLLDITTSADRSTAMVTFPMPEKKFTRMFMFLNHCRTNGKDSVNIYVNGKPLKQASIDTPVFDYEEQVFRIPYELCKSGENTISIKLDNPHRGQYWLLDARVDAYEESQLVLFFKNRPGTPMTGSLYT